MKLIPNFTELLHNVKLLSQKKCFFIEFGDEKYIERWIIYGGISCELEKLFEWSTKEYKLKHKQLNEKDKHIIKTFEEISIKIIELIREVHRMNHFNQISQQNSLKYAEK